MVYGEAHILLLNLHYDLKIRFYMLIQAYSLITNKIIRSFNMGLLGGINNSNQYIIKIY